MKLLKQAGIFTFKVIAAMSIVGVVKFILGVVTFYVLTHF